MRRELLWMAIILAALMGGACQRVNDELNFHRELNSAMVQTMTDEALANAIVRQRSLFPYHFVPDSAKLNPLGEHDLDILAAYYRGVAGSIAVHGDGVEPTLQTSREQSVLAYLAGRDVPAGNVKVVASPPDGANVPAEQLLLRYHAGEDRIGKSKAKNNGVILPAKSN